MGCVPCVAVRKSERAPYQPWNVAHVVQLGDLPEDREAGQLITSTEH